MRHTIAELMAAARLDLFGTGTSEGADKGWDTRGRGKKDDEPEERVKKLYDVTDTDLEKLGKILQNEGFVWKGSEGSFMDQPRQGGLTYAPFARTTWQHPDGHEALVEARMVLRRAGDRFVPRDATATLHLRGPDALQRRVVGTLHPFVGMDARGRRRRRIRT